MSGWRDIDAFLSSKGIRFGYQGICQTDGPRGLCGHAAGSYHYEGWARDYGNADSDCLAILRALEPFAHDGTLLELFFAPTNTWMSHGRQLSRAAIGDHDDHVHAAIDPNRTLPLLVVPPPPPPRPRIRRPSLVPVLS